MAVYGANSLRPSVHLTTVELFLSQFKSPVILILLFAAIVAFFVGDTSDAVIILTIVGISGTLSFWQEKGARDAAGKLLQLVQVTATVIRNKEEKEIVIDNLVLDDLVVLHAGDIIPGDGHVLEAKDLFVDEAALTGETYPVEKDSGGSVYMGTHVISGWARVQVTATGKETKFGQVAIRLAAQAPETEFEAGIRQFGQLLMVITLILVLAIFAINVFLSRPVLESFLFALALAVGLTPELLPVVVTLNLSKGAKKMAQGKVIVKRLSAIENFGSMNILCADKTGTLTEGKITVEKAIDADNYDSQNVWQLAFLNSSYESGFQSPIDEAIRQSKGFSISGFSKLDEIPYDFIRKRLSILVKNRDGQRLITKGAVPSILAVSSVVQQKDGKTPLSQAKEKLDKLTSYYGQQGKRLIAVAYKEIKNKKLITNDDESDMILAGFLVLSDPLKLGVTETVASLKKLGVALKIITGDSRLVAQFLAEKVGIEKAKILTGSEIARLSGDALSAQVTKTSVFAEVEPNQKERIILALRKRGNVVGFLGDGINDASALHSADVSISVNTGVDVAKEAASIILLRKDLHILKEGIIEGRKTFANTMKYIFLATSANFGNMFSMAGASLFLPFLPLLPKQILLLNLLTDFPEMTIASDNVDPSWTEKPKKWDIGFIRRFMLMFGPISSFFDFLTFASLLILRVGVRQFQTGWFLESVISATIIVLVVRSRKPFFQSRPGKLLFITTLIIVFVSHLMPYTFVGRLFGFQPLPLTLVLLIDFIVVLYVFAAEAAKKIFYAGVKLSRT